MKPIESVYIARLFFNKSLIQYHDSLFYMMHSLASSRLVNNWHMGDTDGLAVDIRVPSRPLRLVRDAALSLKSGGVGYYAGSDFVHVDVGRVRSW